MVLCWFDTVSIYHASIIRPRRTLCKTEILAVPAMAPVKLGLLSGLWVCELWWSCFETCYVFHRCCLSMAITLAAGSRLDLFCLPSAVPVPIAKCPQAGLPPVIPRKFAMLPRTHCWSLTAFPQSNSIFSMRWRDDFASPIGKDSMIRPRRSHWDHFSNVSPKARVSILQ